MYNRVAKTKSLKTAWELIERLQSVCPCNEFVVVLRGPEASPEIHPVGAFHPTDKANAKDAVKAFGVERQRELGSF